jgi:Protein of unknown function (DUF2442)
MTHSVYKIVDFEIIGSYTLRLVFDDGIEQEINFESVLEGEVYGRLRDVKFFNQVTLDPEVHTVVWPNGADFDPETLHNWPKYAGEMQAKAREWAKTRA